MNSGQECIGPVGDRAVEEVCQGVLERAGHGGGDLEHQPHGGQEHERADNRVERKPVYFLIEGGLAGFLNRGAGVDRCLHPFESPVGQVELAGVCRHIPVYLLGFLQLFGDDGADFLHIRTVSRVYRHHGDTQLFR